MKIGREAIDALVHNYPMAHKNFGDHRDIHSFAVRLSGLEFMVLELRRNWVIIQRNYMNPAMGEVHWFCPLGCDIKAIREMLAYAYDNGMVLLTGVTPEDHVNARNARVLNRAVGARKVEGHYLLTKSQFVNYTARKQSKMR